MLCRLDNSIFEIFVLLLVGKLINFEELNKTVFSGHFGIYKDYHRNFELTSSKLRYIFCDDPMKFFGNFFCQVSTITIQIMTLLQDYKQL